MASTELEGRVSRGVVWILCLAALIALPGAGVGEGAERRVFNIAVGHDWGPHEYISDDGYIQGFLLDLITEVCEAANIQCRTIWDKYTNCWDSTAGRHSYGGHGLMGGWYDACGGWVGSVNRMQVFDFSLPFFEVQKTLFYVKKGRTFNIYTDLPIVKAVGFMDGWASDEKCLARQTMIAGHVLPVEKIKHYLTTDEIEAALMSGEIDVIFSTFRHSLEKVDMASNDYFSCSPSGNSMMTRKDNPFNGFWNIGFQQLMANGRFRKLCAEAPDKHGAYGELDECVK